MIAQEIYRDVNSFYVLKKIDSKLIEKLVGKKMWRIQDTLYVYQILN